MVEISIYNVTMSNEIVKESSGSIVQYKSCLKNDNLKGQKQKVFFSSQTFSERSNHPSYFHNI